MIYIVILDLAEKVAVLQPFRLYYLFYALVIHKHGVEYILNDIARRVEDMGHFVLLQKVFVMRAVLA